jgi:hypothetical protein
MNAVKKVRAYYSRSRRRGGGVYHDRVDCPAGRRILSQDLARGGGRLPLCPQCRALEERDPDPGP